ncbi:MAG: DUF5041 domain-containing protein [Bacteroidales bacterium]|jgi:hypothetical protein|nr:DUF5041 domain-containing protein [Bacteroidales bacterium]
MKIRNILTIALLLTTAFAVGQEYRKDLRSQEEKDDRHDTYQLDRIRTSHLLKALEMAGIRIFVFPLNPFDKEYKLELYLNEYVNGEKIKSDHFGGNNMYVYFTKEEQLYADYIDNITFYTKDVDSLIVISIGTYSFSLSGMKLKKNKMREEQFYNWRSYSQTDWKIGEEVPLLVYASSWRDEQFNVERFCGASDLSKDEKETRELLSFSPHYFIFTYKIYE